MGGGNLTGIVPRIFFFYLISHGIYNDQSLPFLHCINKRSVVEQRISLCGDFWDCE